MELPDKQNGPDEDELKDEYLVYGHFDQRTERDKKGHDTTVWLSLSLLCEAFEEDEAALDEALAAWETESAKRRVERLRELREAR